MRSQDLTMRFHLSLAILLLAIGPFAARVARAATYTNAATGPWRTPSTWTANSGYPVAGETALISGGYTVTTTAGDAANSVDVGNATLSQLTIDGNLTLSSTTLYNFRIGPTASTHGKVVHQSGDVTNDRSLDLAQGASSSGSYEMTGGSLSLTHASSSLLRIGVTGTGTFTQAGSSAVTVNYAGSAEGFIIGNNATGNGTYTMSGGTLTAVGGSSAIGLNGTGTMTIVGTAQANLKSVVMGKLVSGSAGTLDLSGGTLRLSSLSKGVGTAIFNFSGGTLSPYNANATIGSATAANNTTITLSGTDATISSEDKDATKRTVNIYSKLTGSGAITFTGGGTNVLWATNDYSGGTTLTNGRLVVSMAAALPGYGTPNKFSAAPGAMLALNYGGASDWVSGEVDSLLSQNGAGFASGSTLGFDTSNGNGEYAGNITLAGVSLVKSGTNTLTLSGANTYSGNTTINGGALRLNNASALGGGNLTLNGSVLELQNPSTFTRTLGSGAGEVQLTNASGFSAYGSAATVNLNNDHSELVWGSAYFNPGPLILNSTNANAALDFQNPIDLLSTGGSITRTVQVNAATATLNYPLRSSSGTASLAKTGAGTLTLTANNPIAGSVTVTNGELNLASGCLFTNQYIIPSAAGATVRLTGGIVTNKATTVNMNYGSFIQESGTNVFVAALRIGNLDASVGALYQMDGGYLKVAEGPYIGNNSQGPCTFIQTGGTVDMMRSGGTVLQMGGLVNRSTPGFYTISGGTVNALATTLQIGNAGGGSASASTGTLTIASAAVVNTLGVMIGINNNTQIGVGILNLEGGVLRATSVYNGGTGAVHQLNFSGGTLAPYNANATIGSATAANNTTITLSGTDATISSSDKDGAKRTVNIYSKLTGSGAVTFTGSGTNILFATNDYTGSTTISAGMLKIGTGGAIEGSSNICVKSGATLDVKSVPYTLLNGQSLGGAGTVTGDVIVAAGGILAPGDDGQGVLNMTTGSVQMAAGAVYNLEIGGTTESPTNDMINLTGAGSTVNFSGAWTLNINSVGTVDPAGKTFVLFDYTGSNPANAGSPTISFGSGAQAQSWRDGSVSVDAANKRIILTGVTAVSEGSIYRFY